MAILTTTRFDSTQRLANTVYHNTTGHAVVVEARLQSVSGVLDVIAYSDAANPPTTQVARHVGHGTDNETLIFVVPDTFYWKIACLSISETHETQIATTVTDSGDVAGSRALDIAYPNAGTTAMLVIVQFSGVTGTNPDNLEGKEDPATSPTSVVFSESPTAGTATVVMFVPAGHYYLVTQHGLTPTITAWHERTLGFTLTRSANLGPRGRASGGIYQNTDTEARYVVLIGASIGSGTSYFAEDTVNPPLNWAYAVAVSDSGNTTSPLAFVPPGHYYQGDRDSGFISLLVWFEYAVTAADDGATNGSSAAAPALFLTVVPPTRIIDAYLRSR